MRRARLPVAALLDTSVLLRLFLPHRDELAPATDALGEAHASGTFDLVLLDLSIYEFVNVLVRRGGRGPEEVDGDVRALYELGAPVYAVEESLARAAGRLAARTGLSGYDAAFVAAARILGLPLITTDAAILRCEEEARVVDLATFV